MTNKNLVERLNFDGDDVFLDGKVIFSVPHRDTESEINLLGVPQHGRMIYIGSGKCCYGPITILDDVGRDGETPKFRLESFRVPDFNVYDIIPASVDYRKTGFANGGAILTTGYGCAGSGVRLIDTYYPKTINVVSEEEFQKIRMRNDPSGRNYLDKPRLNVNKEQKDIITLDWLGESKDLTPILKEIGVDVEKTIEVNKGYTRIRH